MVNRSNALKSTLGVFCLWVGSCCNPSVPNSEEIDDLGHGFRLIVVREPSVATFESIGHFKYLFYKNKKIAQSESACVSPSGDGVVFESAVSGRLVYYDKKNAVDLTHQPASSITQCRWFDSDGSVEIELYGRSNLILKIPG